MSNELRYATFKTPFGTGLVAARDGQIVRVRLSSAGAPSGGVEDRAALKPLVAKLERYFAGEPVRFDDEWLGIEQTPFTSKVMSVVRAIPRGRTLSYAEVARKAGSPRAARAVGNVMRRNPVPIVVPCHRVVGANGALGGFTGGLNRKKLLLALESAKT